MGFLIARYPIAFHFITDFSPVKGSRLEIFPGRSPLLFVKGPAARCAAGLLVPFLFSPRGEDAVFRYSRPNAFWVSARGLIHAGEHILDVLLGDDCRGSNRMVLALTKVPAVSTFRANMPLAHA